MKQIKVNPAVAQRNDRTAQELAYGLTVTSPSRIDGMRFIARRFVHEETQTSQKNARQHHDEKCATPAKTGLGNLSAENKTEGTPTGIAM